MNYSVLNKLEFFRKRNHFTQEQLANLINVERYRIADWEQGRSQPSLENLIKLSNVLNVSIESLLNIINIKVEESSDKEILDLITKKCQTDS